MNSGELWLAGELWVWLAGELWVWLTRELSSKLRIGGKLVASAVEVLEAKVDSSPKDGSFLGGVSAVARKFVGNIKLGG